MSLSRRRFLGVGASGLATATAVGCDLRLGSDEPRSGQRRSLSEFVDALPPLTRPGSISDADWASIRSRFILEPQVAYMNNASLGMPPAPVALAVANGYEAISREPLHGKHDLQDTIAQRVLPSLARAVGADIDEVSLTRNATEALHLAAVGIDLGPGDEVLVTSQEHPAGLAPWDFVAATRGVMINTVFIPSPFESGDHVVERMAEALTPRTRVMAFCHVTRGGHLYPVKKLAALARDRGVLSHVDGAQALGMFPVDVHDLGCDSYSASLHKWLLGPIGTGMLYVRGGARESIRSAFARIHRGGDTPSGIPGSASPVASAFAPHGPGGTADLPVRAGLAAALDQLEVLGVENVAARTRFLSDQLKAGLGDLPGVTLLSGPTPETSCPGSTIFELAGVDAVEAVPRIEAIANIHLDEHQRDGHNAIRISTHVYNTTEEVHRVLEGLRQLASSAG
ncbi:MAG: aminotransferase class V-fold PLP-dependent enzyme [Gemmatimonadota bacterium]|nr:aminotransferase class V-fold PLP-dependent enzyme [Gemmatimonadota bacterium]